MASSILARNNVQVLGTGTRPIMFAHGFGCDQAMWRFVAPAFADRYRVVLFDYVGAGKSDASAFDPVRYSALDGYATDVLEICEALDLTDVIFVGHSVSATVGMLAAVRSPSTFSELVLIGPSPCFVNHPPEYAGGFERADLVGLLDMMDKNYTGWAGALAPLIVGNPDSPEYAQELEASFCATTPAFAARFAEATFLSDHRADVPRVSVPSLIMQCAQDAIAPESVGLWLASHLPMSTYRALQATGHCSHLTHPAETLAVIREYLAQREGAVAEGTTAPVRSA